MNWLHLTITINPVTHETKVHPLTPKGDQILNSPYNFSDENNENDQQDDAVFM